MSALSAQVRQSRVDLPVREDRARKLQITRLDMALMGLATLVAAFFRFYQLDAIPPGLHYDEAFEGLVARELLETGRLKIFFEGNFGLEPLSVYLLAGLYLVFGVSATTVRLMPAIAGVLTVPALYLLARELFPQGVLSRLQDRCGLSPQNLSRTSAFLAAIALAVMFWHVTFSRYGVETNLVPLFEVLAFYFLWRGFRTHGLLSFIASGVCFGLSLYTYQSARLLPFLVAVFLAYRLLSERRRFIVPYWKGALVLAVAASITFAPLGYYFYRHPEWFTLRAGQVQTVNRGQSAENMLALNARKTLTMFLSRGDEDPRSNIPGRPVLDPFLALPFLLGAAITVMRLGRPQYGFLAIWFVVMLIPTVLSEHAPHFRRALGAAPAVAILIALGLTAMLTAGLRVTGSIGSALRRPLRAMATLALVGLVAISAFITYRDYFLVWGRSDDLFSAFDVGVMDVVRFANELPADTQVFLSPIPRAHPTIEFAIGRGRRLKSFDGRRGFVFPARADVDAAYIVFTEEDNRSVTLLQKYFPGVKPLREGKSWDGRPYFSIFAVPGRSHRNVTPLYPRVASLANKVGLLGYDTPRVEYGPGDVIPLFLYWQAREPMRESYTVFTHLLGPWDDVNKTAVWGQQDRLPLGGTYLTRDWDRGDVVVDEYAIPIRKDAPSGEYEIEVGMYLLETMQRLPVVDPATGKQVDDRVVLGTVQIR